MQNLHGTMLCWILKKNVWGRLSYNHTINEYLFERFHYDKGIIVPENGYFNEKEDTFYVEDMGTNCGIINISVYSNITKERYELTDEDIAEHLCYIVKNVWGSTACYDPIAKMYAMSIRKGKRLPRGYAFADNNRRIIHEETGKIICRCFPQMY